ncbi:MAG: FliM/FliN family flagellar motor switch protein [SAR324 cluster bacterium]|nr:FliM/FliN family flagellar motor switch protein [SAR324 cluster bacterium]
MTTEKKEIPKKVSTQAIQLERLLDMQFKARLILGGCTMEVDDILALGQGAVLELDTPITEPIQIWVNDRLIAKAETVVVNERFGAKIVEIASKEERLKDMADVS